MTVSKVSARASVTKLGESLVKFAGHDDWVREASFAPGGAFVVTASYDGSARLWNAASGECVQVFTGNDAAAAVAAFDHNTAWLRRGRLFIS